MRSEISRMTVVSGGRKTIGFSRICQVNSDLYGTDKSPDGVKIFPFIKDRMRRTIVTERRETALKDIDKRMADT